jgi:hypothetical protein
LVTDEGSHYTFFIQEDLVSPMAFAKELWFMPPFILISFLHPFSIDHNMLILRHKDFQLGSYFQVQVYRPFVVVELPFKPILTLSFFSWPSRCDIGLKVLPFSFVPLKNTAQAISYLVAFKKQEDHIFTQVMPR